MEDNDNLEVNVETNEVSAIEQDFDPNGFMSDMGGSGDAQVADESLVAEAEIENEAPALVQETETEEVKNEKTDTSIEIDGNDETDWDTAYDAKKTEDVVEDTVEAVEETETGVQGWEKLSEELGIEAESYDDLMATLKSREEIVNKSATSEKIENLKSFLELDNEAIVREELKAQGYNEEEIELEIDDLVESNALNREGRKIKKQLEQSITYEREQLINSKDQARATQEEQAQKFKTDLQEHLSKTNEMFGGKVNKEQKQKHFNYVSSGEFENEITGDISKYSEAAWLWKNRETILKSFRNKGVEQGKSMILDNIEAPERTRTTTIPDPSTGSFNPSRFLNSDKM